MSASPETLQAIAEPGDMGVESRWRRLGSQLLTSVGPIVLAFIAWHLLDLTGGQANPSFVLGDPYNNLVASFERPVVAAFYVIANVLLGIHLFHGVWSMFQSLGANSPRFNMWRRRIAEAIALVIVVGNVSFPIAVTLGVIEAEPVARVEVCAEREELATSDPCREALREAGQEAGELVEEDD